MMVSSRECWVNTQYLAAGCKHKAKNRLKSVWHIDFFEWFVPVWQMNKIKFTEKNNRPELPFFFPACRTLPGVYVTFVLWKMKKKKIHISWRGCRNFQQSFSHGRQLNLVPYEREVAVAGEAGERGGLQAWPLLLSRAGVSAALRQFTHAGRRCARVTAVDDECNCDVHGNVNLKSFAVVQSQATPSVLRETH